MKDLSQCYIERPTIPLILFESQNFLNVTGFFYFLKYSKFKMLEFLASTTPLIGY